MVLAREGLHRSRHYLDGDKRKPSARQWYCDANSLPQQAIGVGISTKEISLKDSANAAGKLRRKALGHRNGRLRVRRAFHVNPDERLYCSSVLNHLADRYLLSAGQPWFTPPGS